MVTPIYLTDDHLLKRGLTFQVFTERTDQRQLTRPFLRLEGGAGHARLMATYRSRSRFSGLPGASTIALISPSLSVTTPRWPARIRLFLVKSAHMIFDTRHYGLITLGFFLFVCFIIITTTKGRLWVYRQYIQ